MSKVNIRVMNKQIANDNRLKPSLIEVDELADKLCSQYNNYGYRKWYCRVIYTLGIHRVEIIAADCRDADEPGRLFTIRANAELKAKLNKEKLQIKKDLYEGRFGL